MTLDQEVENGAGSLLNRRRPASFPSDGDFEKDLGGQDIDPGSKSANKSFIRNKRMRDVPVAMIRSRKSQVTIRRRLPPFQILIQGCRFRENAEVPKNIIVVIVRREEKRSEAEGRGVEGLAVASAGGRRARHETHGLKKMDGVSSTKQRQRR